MTHNKYVGDNTVKSVMKPMYNGFFSKINELHWICEKCGKEFLWFEDGKSPYRLAEEHEKTCKGI